MLSSYLIAACTLTTTPNPNPKWSSTAFLFVFNIRKKLIVIKRNYYDIKSPQSQSYLILFKQNYNRVTKIKKERNENKNGEKNPYYLALVIVMA